MSAVCTQTHTHTYALALTVYAIELGYMGCVNEILSITTYMYCAMLCCMLRICVKLLEPPYDDDDDDVCCMMVVLEKESENERKTISF